MPPYNEPSNGRYRLHTHYHDKSTSTKKPQVITVVIDLLLSDSDQRLFIRTAHKLATPSSVKEHGSRRVFMHGSVY